MTRIIMCGCNGAMGRMITGIVNEDAEAEIVAGIDMVDTKEHCYPVFQKLADALIDFSTPKILDDILTFSKEKKVPVVLCTTGYDDEQLAKIEEAATQTAVLKSANMSLGINTLLKLVQDAAKVFVDYYLSKEGQEALREADARVMARGDVDVPSEIGTVDTTKLIKQDVLLFGSEREALLEKWDELAGEKDS